MVNTMAGAHQSSKNNQARDFPETFLITSDQKPSRPCRANNFSKFLPADLLPAPSLTRTSLSRA